VIAERAARMGRILIAGARRPAALSVTEWADAYRFLASEASAEPGRFSSARTPYMREPMEVIGDPKASRVVLMFAAQLGKTTLLENVIGHAIQCQPRPMLMIQPTLEAAEQWSKERFAGMARETPSLRALVTEARSRSTSNTLRMKLFPHGYLAIVGSNAPAGLAGRAIALVLADEIDRWEPSAGSEGDALALAARRLATFEGGKLVLTSTPGNKDESRIAQEYDKGDARLFWVPCPHCGHFQTLQFGGPSMAFGLKWDEGKPETAQYLCESCAALIDEKEKPGMLARGEWRASEPTHPYPSFFLNGLYSPFPGNTWAHIARDFLAGKDNPEKLKVFVTTQLAEPWEEPGERIESHALLARLEHYKAPVPMKVGLLTAGVDVQDDRLEMRVWGWGAGEESWLVRAEIIPGDPGTPHPWRELDHLRRQPLQHESGATLGIACTFVDSGGHHTSQVYAYCRERAHEGVCACKGMVGDGVHLCGKPSYAGAARVALYPVGTHQAKERFLRSQLRIPVGQPGSVHLPEDVDVEELEQLTAEKLVSRFVKGRVKKEWIPLRARGEALDCRVYAMAALYRLGPQVIGQLGARAAELAAAAARAASPPAPATYAPNVVPFRPPKPPNWVNRWR
jgi:phage terminase large subunit GpA-like protein